MLNGYDAYRQMDVLAADPVRLVALLYGAATKKVREVRECLRRNDIAGRSAAVVRLNEIVLELVGSLDHERGGDISRRLAALYEYMLHLIATGNFEQSDRQFADLEGLLVTMSEAWDTLAAHPERAEEPQGTFLMPPAEAAAGMSCSY